MIEMLSEITSMAAVQLGYYGCWGEQFRTKRHVECLLVLSFLCLDQ